MIRDIFDYILYRITHANKWWFDVTASNFFSDGLGYEGYAILESSLILTLNLLTIISFIPTLSFNPNYVFLIILCLILFFLIIYSKRGRRYKALAHKYKNEKYHKLKGYAVLAYVILSIVFFFVVIFSK
jgi:hypothetical protein